MQTLLKDYLPLFKFRICSLIAFSALTGFIAASSSGFNLTNAVLLVGVTMMSSAGASAFNHCFDRDIDGIMKRTRSRPMPSGRVTDFRAVMVAACLLFAASIFLSWKFFNVMVALHLFLGGFVYAIVYTVWLKRRTSMNIVVGGLAGSFAVLAGGASGAPGLCVPALLLAVIMFFWTPSHFWSFAIVHSEEYKKAGVPMLPNVIGDAKTARWVFLNTVLLVASSLAPVLYGSLGIFYAVSAVSLGAFFLVKNAGLVKCQSKESANGCFKASMVYLGCLFLAVMIDASL
ncbi:protoheme IX farnesyltransferase [bacterium]|nr:MAG: protoheme IX farnesyltransferase [bacterium]